MNDILPKVAEWLGWKRGEGYDKLLGTDDWWVNANDEGIATYFLPSYFGVWRAIGEIFARLQQEPEDVRRNFSFELTGILDVWPTEPLEFLYKFDELTPALVLEALAEVKGWKS